MTTDEHPTGSTDRGHDAIPQYEIRVTGAIGPRWTAWFDGLTVTGRADGTTLIHGGLVDQAALHGVLQRLRDLGIPLVSVNRITPDALTGSLGGT